MENKICGIYKIENKVNGKIYIGQSVDIKSRWRGHRHYLNTNTCNNNYLQNAWNKYKKDNFKFEIMEECLKDELNEKEIYYINKFNSTNDKFGYNLEGGGNHKASVSKETREKLSVAIYNSNNTGRPVICLNTMEIFPKMRLAYEKYNITRSSLNYCCRDILKFAGRMEDGTPIQWEYYEKEKIYEYKKLRTILQYSIDGKLIKEYNTLKLASIETNVSSGAIGNSCRGICNSSGCYIWMYSDNAENIQNRVLKYKKQRETTQTKENL